MTVQGIINGHIKGKASINIQGCKYRGTLSLKHHELEEDIDESSYVE